MNTIIKPRKNNWFIKYLIYIAILTVQNIDAKPYVRTAGVWKNNLPPRLQWYENYGYCGEVSFISAGLYYGQYLSQYTVRAIASQNTPQNQQGSQLLLGVNDLYTAQKLHLKAIAWHGEKGESRQFLTWVKGNVLKGYPVIIGVYTNEYCFYRDTDPDAGENDYDHIVPVFGIGSNHPLTSLSYYPDDTIYFSDNGLWGTSPNFPYIFTYPFSTFQASREQANRPSGTIYSLTDTDINYGTAIMGVNDLNGDTVPIRLKTNVNTEIPEIQDGTSIQPLPKPVQLTITLSNLQPNITYNLYRYNAINKVPDSHFNSQASHAFKQWTIRILSGNSFAMTETIQSNEIAIYRAVKATAE